MHGLKMAPKRSRSELRSSPAKQRKEPEGGGGWAATEKHQKDKHDEEEPGGSGGDIIKPEKCPLTGIMEPKVTAESMRAWEAEIELYKPNSVTIFVDKKDKCPGKVFFVRREEDVMRIRNGLEPVDKDDYFRVLYHSADKQVWLANTVPKEGPKRRKRSATDNSQEDLKVVQDIITHLGSVLQIAGPGEGNFGHWIHTKHYQDHEAKIKAAFEENEIIAGCFRRAHLVRAFCKRMTKSAREIAAGEIALENLVEMAAIISFGRKEWARGSISCNSVGTGPDETEQCHAPPSLYEEEYVHDPECRCRSCVLQDTVGCDENSSTADSRKSSCFVELPQGGVYADVIAISGCQPNWPHFILVGEIKSSSYEEQGFPFTETALSRLICNMVGTMLRQSVVFGILLNDKGAMLSCMEIDFERKVIDVTSQNYSFVPGIGRSFNATSLNSLFLDIVKAFNYGKENIKEVSHR